MLFSKIEGNISKEKYWLERIAVKRIYAAKKPICSTVLKIEVSIPEEKHWLETIASWSDISLFNYFIILVRILLSPSLISWFKVEIMLDSVEIM